GDWTLLVTSAEFGDKLPIGFRGCHAALATLPAGTEAACDLPAVAALPNHVAAQLPPADGAGVRVFAPAMRKMRHLASPLPGVAEEPLVRHAAERASAAAALVLDRPEFGFPTTEEIDRALRAGAVG